MPALDRPRLRLTLDMARGDGPPVVLFRRSGFASIEYQWPVVAKWYRELNSFLHERAQAWDASDA